MIFRYTLFSVSLALPTVAQDLQADNCVGIGDLAEQIMIARQMEIPVSSMISEGIPKNQPEAFQTLVREMILTAYGQPAMRTEANKERQKKEFRNNMELLCYRSGLSSDRALGP